MKRNKQQKGFTIIELVVVILLLGILTATALPRFMDVTTEAHAAVVDSVKGGLVTGLALYRAQWYAEGQPTVTAVSEFGGNLIANAAGYPLGTNSVLTDASSTDGTECLTIYNNLFQTGRPDAAAIQYSATPATLETAIEAVASTNDFAISASSISPATGCVFYYIGQIRTGTLAVPTAVPTLTYLFSDGSVTSGSVPLATGV